MKDILKIETVEQYNDFFGFETLHPLVNIVDFDERTAMSDYTMTIGLYALFLKNTKGCTLNYGKTVYDYDDRTVVCFAPGQTIGVGHIEGKLPSSTGLIFDPSFLYRTPLAQKMRQYSFFSYASNEALHLSQEERRIVYDCLNMIRIELKHPIDRHTKEIVVSNIEMLLNYCMRFYDRQFITRENMNHDVLTRFEQSVDNFLQSDDIQKDGLPSVKYFADKMCLSANYFGDLVKKETGKSAQEYIQLKMIGYAKEELMMPDKSIAEVAYSLGFQYPQHFARFFKNKVGVTPKDYRSRN
jgi:AraC-like DNA-binding protein